MSQTPIAEQLAGLSSAIITVYTQLVAFTEPATVDDIAQAAQSARSSTFKALVALEKRGLAHRDRGIQNGPNRRPDLWRATHTAPAPTPNEAPAEAELAEPMPDTEPASEPADTPEPKTEPESKPDEPTVDEPEENSDAPEPEDAAPAAPLPAQRTKPAEPTNPIPISALPGGNKRLAPGGLRQLVIDYLHAHPGEAFTATRISRVIDRSSGAIANVLTTLAKQGIAEQVTDRPRTYRAAPPEQAV
jgi:predicted transcriptional regulator